MQRHVLDVDPGLAEREGELGHRPGPVGDDHPQLAQRAADLASGQAAAVGNGGGVPFSDPVGVARADQLARLAQAAADGGVRARLLYGVALQRLGRPISAEREFAAAAAAAPENPEAQVAAAVGRFDKDAPQRAFSRLGPLARRFPRAPTVRFHLGLLLLWLGDVKDARVQLRRAAAEGPATPLGREAQRFLDRLAGSGTG